MSKNPQSNVICEWMHQTVSNVLWTLVNTPPQSKIFARDIIDDALAMGMHAMRTTVATTLGSGPGSLAFVRDMFLNNVPLVSDWQSIAQLCDHHVHDNLRQANRKHYQFDDA